MSPGRRLLNVVVLGIVLLSGGAGESAAPPVPSAEEVAGLIAREPITLESWPKWRERLLGWMGDRSKKTDPAFEAGRTFVRGLAGDGSLPPDLEQDHFAWYLLGSSLMYEPKPSAAARLRAQQALRRSIQLDPKFPQAHRNLATLLIHKEGINQASPEFLEAQRELAEAVRLDPRMPGLKSLEGEVALILDRFAEAERAFTQGMNEDPENAEGYAVGLVIAKLRNPASRTGQAAAIRPLLERFPSNGVLVCLHAVALANEEQWGAARRELERARGLGVDPSKILPPQAVAEIEKHGAPGWVEQVLWVLLYFAGFYAVVMLLMALAGYALAQRTRGTKALDLLSVAPEEIVAAGQVARTSHETSLAKYYALAILAGLVLFYLAIPFVIGGLVTATVGLLMLIFQAGRVPVKLVALVVIVGGGMAWAVLKSLFARPAAGSFGVPKKAADCPRLHDVLAEVARRVDTDPVDEVYLAPGASIGVHQEGRGPFGLFGVKNRVLTLGLSTMNCLTVGELKAILAHEYAHFSHSDTFYNRFIYQVSLSIGTALDGMGQAGGWFNYINPFFWFLVLYHKAFHLLSAGFSRSREFLADRMACCLYGSDVFGTALAKVATDGTLFEMTIYQNIEDLLAQDKAFINMYDAFRNFRDEQLKGEERDDLYRKLLDEEGSIFASHPTFKERVEAAAALPKAANPETASALTLFEDSAEIEKELTEFLTGFMAHVRQLRAEAEAQAQA